MSSRPLSGATLKSSHYNFQTQAASGSTAQDTHLPDTQGQDPFFPSDVSPVDDMPDPATQAFPEAQAVLHLPVGKAQDDFDPFAGFSQPMPASQEPAENIPMSVVDSAAAASYAPTPPNLHAPLPLLADTNLAPPRASYLESDLSASRDSSAPPSINNSSHLLTEKRTGSDIEEPSLAEKRKSKRPILVAALAAIVLIALAAVLPVYFVVVKKHNSNSASSSGSSSGGPKGSGATTGGDGSVITTETGDTFTYKNPFGGIWVDDPNDPYSLNAQVNSWTPPLNTSWTWGTNKVYGVNLGGLFVLEPFISPALYQKYPGSHDEWTLSTLMAADTASGGLNQLEDHYKTFVTEQDIAEIAGAGLNWVRLPIPFWAIETWEGEPFLAKVSWKYILKVLGWARKYGLRVNLDLHTIPGSQNGYNHSGKQGMINFLNGVMGIANAQRALGYIRIITEFISQPEWQPVVPMFGIVNEAIPATIGLDILSAFYLEAYNMIRSITGVGANNGPYISIHDGFLGYPQWAGFFSGSDRMILDTHPYFAFGNGTAVQPIATGTGPGAGGVWPAKACTWGNAMNVSQRNFGVTVAGEFSNGFNDCGLFIHGVGGVATYGGNCDDWTDSSNWDAATKAGIQAFAMASMDALQNWFFWTWKIGNSTAGHVEAPLWSYQLGLENGWMPTDPRQIIGTCGSLGVKGVQFDGNYHPWQTGGVGAGTIVASATARFGQWPPISLNGLDNAADATLLPTYTSTGPVATLPPPTLTASATHSIDLGDGWYNTADTGLGATPIAGCSYPDPWDAVGVPIPPACGGNAAAVAARALVTPPPVRR